MTRSFYELSMTFVDGYGMSVQHENMKDVLADLKGYDHEGSQWEVKYITERDETQTVMNLYKAGLDK